MSTMVRHSRSFFFLLGGLAACVDPKDGGWRTGPAETDSGDQGGDGSDGGGDGGADGSTDGSADGGSDGGSDGATDGGGDGGTDGSDVVPTLPEEVRGIWITRYVWSDEDDIRRILDEVADAGFNAVFFQVRGTHDAYYASAHEPWALRLTGTLGADPGWDPLGVAIEVAHSRGMELHAYLNTVPLWQGTTPPSSSTPEHAWNEHPDWRIADATGTPLPLNSSYVYASPGNPDMRERVAAVAADIAANYEVDGIHLDYIRYPSSSTSRDEVSVARYEADDLGLSWEDWQREQVNLTVAGVSDAVGLPVTAAVWGIYEDSFGWGGVSEGNPDYYQDSRAFTNRGLLDAIVPMIYWPVTDTPGARLDFATLVEDHVSHSPPGTVIAGVGNDMSFEELVTCIRVARASGTRGVIVFDYSLFATDLSELATVFAEEPG